MARIAAMKTSLGPTRKWKQQCRRCIYGLLLLGLMIMSLPTHAHTADEVPLAVHVEGSGIRLSWHGKVERSPTGTPFVPGWSHADIGGYELPVQLVTLEASGTIEPRFDHLVSVPWTGRLESTQRASLPAQEAFHVLAQPSNSATLSESPVVLLRDARVRGRRLIVLAVTPIFAQAAEPRAVTELEVTVPDVQPAVDNIVTSDHALSPHSAMSSAIPALPPNAAARQDGIKVYVQAAGMQRITHRDLTAAGMQLDALDASRLQLRRAGVPTALEEHRGDDGRVEELWFYASPPGDRWNSTDTYWLTLEQSPGMRMRTRAAAPGEAPLRSTAMEHGVWRHNQVYDSTQPGPDGDHWYSSELRSLPDTPSPTLAIPMTATLPLVAGTTTLTITGSAYTTRQHALALEAAGTTAIRRWQGGGDWSHGFSFADKVSSARATILAGTAVDGVEIDSVTWERPIALDVRGQGALFHGLTGVWRYQLANTAAERALYDITDPTSPVRLVLPAGRSPEFEDGPTTHVYLLTGPGHIHVPALDGHRGSDLGHAVDATALYIAPAPFHAALAPLLSHRERQGQAARAIDVQAIYDAWSFGQVSPAAIRHFLQYASAEWPQPPSAVILVGDGSSDPHNYLGRNTPNLIPPYLAMVDPWLGETACDTCYVQLDGADPLDDGLPDLSIGRFPVKSSAELDKLVAKIIAYETGPVDLDWQGRSLYIADNFRDAAGNQDNGGDFALFAEQSAALQPEGLEIGRVYYDPWAGSSGMNGHEADAAQAYRRTQDALSRGAALVNYVGHSHHWQWAVTDASALPGHLLGLYDVDKLANAGKLPIVLEMTCLTGAFQTPAVSGTTLDERLLLHPTGGAIAVWGPTVLGVSHGHEQLQRGFYAALWDGRLQRPSLGDLVQAGYLELYTRGGCCQDTLRTFVLLGDPLTVPRVLVPRRVFLPHVQR